METAENYNPKGYLFFDETSGRQIKLVAEDEPRESIRGWLLTKHPDGQWVSLRKATAADLDAVREAMVRDFHADID